MEVFKLIINEKNFILNLLYLLNICINSINIFIIITLRLIFV
jgi:hypothetical protein